LISSTIDWISARIDADSLNYAPHVAITAGARNRAAACPQNAS
jgi:hypothetical protein